jgi:MarR family transcriptional regulator for hemolysin
MIGWVTDQPDILFLLHDVARQLRQDADRRARAYGLTRAQWIILIRLEKSPGLSQKELAEILEVEPITVARLIDRLERHGFVERRDDPSDRRVWRLHLLAPARPVLRDLAGERTAMMHLVSAGMAPDTLARVREALQQIKINVLAENRARASEPAEQKDVA